MSSLKNFALRGACGTHGGEERNVALLKRGETIIYGIPRFIAVHTKALCQERLPKRKRFDLCSGHAKFETHP
jgi:hypothetical protein